MEVPFASVSKASKTYARHFHFENLTQGPVGLNRKRLTFFKKFKEFSEQKLILHKKEPPIGHM